MWQTQRGSAIRRMSNGSSTGSCASGVGRERNTSNLRRSTAGLPAVHFDGLSDDEERGPPKNKKESPSTKRARKSIVAIFGGENATSDLDKEDDDEEARLREIR